MVGEIVVGNGDISWSHNDINESICAIGEVAVINPDVLRPEDVNSIAVGCSSLPEMCAIASNHRRSGRDAVVDVNSVNDDVSHVLQR